MDFISIKAEHEFVPLTDSLASRIRWRACDYASMISAELELILGAHSAPIVAVLNRQNTREDEENAATFHSSIRLFNDRCARAAFLAPQKRPPFRHTAADEDTEEPT